VPLEELAKSVNEQVDVPDTAPPADVTEQGLPQTTPAAPPKVPPKPPIPHGGPGATAPGASQQ